MTLLVGADGDKWINEVTVTVPTSETPARGMTWAENWDEAWRYAKVVSVTGGRVLCMRKDAGSTAVLTTTNGDPVAEGSVFGSVPENGVLSGALGKMISGSVSPTSSSGATDQFTIPSGGRYLTLDHVSGTGFLYVNINEDASLSAYVQPGRIGVGTQVFGDEIAVRPGDAIRMITSTGTSTVRYTVWGVA